MTLRQRKPEDLMSRPASLIEVLLLTKMKNDTA